MSRRTRRRSQPSRARPRKKPPMKRRSNPNSSPATNSPSPRTPCWTLRSKSRPWSNSQGGTRPAEEEAADEEAVEPELIAGDELTEPADTVLDTPVEVPPMVE